MNRRLALLLAIALASASLLGCAKSPQVPVTAGPAAAPAAPASASPSAPVAHTGPGDSKQPSGKLAEMSNMNKLGAINAGFPIEFPVVDGHVVSAEAPTISMLRYVLDVPAPAADVEQWYRRTMKDRLFVLRSDMVSGGALELRYERADVVYTLRFEAETAADSRVIGTLSEN